MALKLTQWLFLLLVVSLPLVRPFNVVIAHQQIPYTDFIFVTVIVLWLAALALRQTRFSFHKASYFIAIYALTLAVSAAFSDDVQKSLVKLAGEYYLFSLAITTYNLAKDRNFLKQIVYAFLVGVAVTFVGSGIGFAIFYAGLNEQSSNYFLSHFGSLPAGNYPRLHSFFANANMMCNYLNIGVIFAFLVAKLDNHKRWVAILFQAGIWFAAVFTFSIGIGGMVLSSGLLFASVYRNAGRKLSKFVLVGCLAFAILVFAAALISPPTDNTDLRTNVPFSQIQVEPSVRVLVWQATLNEYSHNPIFGKGVGINPVALEYRPLAGNSQKLTDAHNIWLNLLGQTGVIGLAAFILLSVFICRLLKFDLAGMGEDRLYLVAFSCAFVGTFLYQGLLGSYEDARHIWILIGLILATSEADKSAKIDI